MLIIGGSNADMTGSSNMANLAKLAAPRTPMIMIGTNDTLAYASLRVPVDATELLRMATGLLAGSIVSSVALSAPRA